MNYESITDKPFIHVEAGASIYLCEDCLERKYTNEPSVISRVYCACERCKVVSACVEMEKARLIPVAPKKRAPKPVSKMVQFGIVKRMASK
jgi:hypothetical protein